MKKQLNQNQSIIKTIMLLLFTGLLAGVNLNAQTDIWEYLGNWYDDLEITDSQEGEKTLTLRENEVALRVPYKGHYNDFMVPDNVSSRYLAITVRGADGGSRINTALITPFRTKGGGGAIIEGFLSIGTGVNEVPPGATLRFIVGKGGHRINSGGSVGGDGGAGTGLFLKKPGESGWHILAVAGGGGGAYSDCCTVHAEGRSASVGTWGEKGGGDSSGGKDGQSGSNSCCAAGGQGLYSERGCIQNGVPVGSTGEHYGTFNQIRDQFGCGGGGPAADTGGGGGGYSGGGAGTGSFSGGGGGSYSNPDWVMGSRIYQSPKTHDPQNGYIDFYFIKGTVSIHLAKNEAKCISPKQSDTTSGANIQLASCDNSAAQQWIVTNASLQLYKDMSKCLDLTNSNTVNGANIQLNDCNGMNAQNWIYDTKNQMIRSAINVKKCLDLVNGNTTDGTNIQLYDCVYGNTKPNQQWVVDGIPALSTAVNQRIHLIADTDKCVDIDQSYTGANGSNIRLYTCHTYNNSQYFIFDGTRIKMQLYPNKCLDLDHSNAANGANIQLWDCNGTDAQNWIYDGFTKAIRSAVDPGKCLDVDHGGTADGTNIQLFDCNGTSAQQFEIY